MVGLYRPRKLKGYLLSYEDGDLQGFRNSRDLQELLKGIYL